MKNPPSADRGLFFEQVIQCHFRLKTSRILVSCQTAGRDHRQVYGFPCLGDFSKNTDLPRQLRIIFLVYSERLGRVLAFAERDDIVCPVEKEINLRTIWMYLICPVVPCTTFGKDTFYAKRLANLPMMEQTKPFKGKAAPNPVRRRIDCTKPEVPVRRPSPRKIAEMKERECVNKLKHTIVPS